MKGYQNKFIAIISSLAIQNENEILYCNIRRRMKTKTIGTSGIYAFLESYQIGVIYNIINKTRFIE